jgi:Cys-tRNA synthase (O-phospho-L-seryl-tRNA:Cys-tRNA synthase)
LTCSACGAAFVTRNASHSCVRRTVEDFFADKSEVGVGHARALIRELEAIGPITLHPVKTRIAIMVEVRFASINRIGRDSIRAHLWMRKSYRSPRFARIEKLGARDWLYHFVVSDEQPIDRELRRFLRLAYQNGRR